MNRLNGRQQDLQTHFESNAYHLLEKIGDGGFGCVFKAKQYSTGQWVAIKFLTIDSQFDADKKRRYIERFDREVLLCSRLQHPNIVRILDKGIVDKGVEDRLIYAVFEYVDGQTLKDHLEQVGALPPVEAARVMTQVLDALAHAHQQGILHRDIKPSNIMLTNTGLTTHVKVLDFGIGTLVNESRQSDYRTITLSEELLGTPAYSAPEQLRGEPATLKTDLYVWGLLFLECLTGRRAVSGNSLAAIFHKQLSQSNIPLPAAIVAHPIGALLRRVLQKKVFERNITADELYLELSKINFANLVGKFDARRDLDYFSNAFAGEDNLETITGTNLACYSGLVERKQITALSICLDMQLVEQNATEVEVLEALYQDQLNQCTDLAIRYGGWHVGTLSDTLLFYFGYPGVSDNDLRLCARTALEIANEIHQRNGLLRHSQGIEFSFKMGIHTGPVTCYAAQTPMGEIANIAMKLARSAMANQVLCSEHSKVLLAPQMAFQTQPSSSLTAMSGTMAAFNLVGERLIEAVTFMSQRLNKLALFGREQELQQLLCLLTEAAPTARAVHVFGEAGIGKSHLVYEVRNRVTGYRQQVAQCFPEHRHNGLYPILELLKSQLGLAELTSEQSLSRLKNVILPYEGAETSNLSVQDAQQSLTILSLWLDLPVEQTAPLEQFSSEQQKQLLFDLLCWLFSMPQQDDVVLPLLLIVEDLHWADPITLAFLAHFRGHATSQSIALIITSRQPLPEKMSNSAIESLTVDRLEQVAAEALICGLFGNKSVSQKLITMLVDRTDGVPLFIEALVDTLQQKALVHENNGIIDFISSEKQAEVPISLRDSLQQKLDGLLYAKETVQFASAIGREFDYELLLALKLHSESEVQQHLQELISADIIFQQRKVGGVSYIFKHALVQEASYEGIPRSRRQQVHDLLSNALLHQFPLRSQQQPHLVAHHLAMAARADEACDWFIRAGDQAAKTFSHGAYIRYYQKAQEQWQQLDEQQKLNESQQRRLFWPYKGIGMGEIALGHHQAGRAAFAKALRLAADNSLEKAQVYYKIGRSYIVDLQHNQAKAAFESAELCLNTIELEVTKNDVLAQVRIKAQLLACRLKIISARINICYGLNDIDGMKNLIDQYSEQALTQGDELQQAYALQDQFQLCVRQQRYALDEKGMFLAEAAWSLVKNNDDSAILLEFQFNYALALYFRAQYRQSFDCLQAVTALAKVSNQASTMALCHTYLAINCRHLRLFDQVHNYAIQALDYASAAGMNSYIAAAKANLAWSEYQKANLAAAIELLIEAVELWHQSPQGTVYPLQWLGRLLQLQLMLHCPQDMVGFSGDQSIPALAELLLDQRQQLLPPAIDQALQQLRDADTALCLQQNLQHLVDTAIAHGFI